MRLKHTVSKKYKINRKHRGKSNKKVRSIKRGGGCGCETVKPVSSFFIGGNGMTTNSLLALPANNYYPLNDFSNDPNYLVVSSGQTGNFVRSGGTRRRQIAKTTRKKGVRKSKGIRYICNATKGGAFSYGLSDVSLTPPQYSMYSVTNPPPSA